MTEERSTKAGLTERAHHAGDGKPAAPRQRRLSAQMKRDAVLRVLRGEDLELVSRDIGTTAADLSRWRDSFLEAGAASLKTRSEDDRDRELKAMREKIGAMTMANELLEAKIERLEAGMPFRLSEVEAMSRTSSPSATRPYGLARVCRIWRCGRSTVYRHRQSEAGPTPPYRRPGPQGPMPDAALAGRIARLLADSPFHGEGYRKVWARLRYAGVRTSPRRVLRVMREQGLLAHQRPGSPRGPRAHDGTITCERVDEMWGTDMTAVATGEGQAAVFIAVARLGRIPRRACEPLCYPL